MLPEELLQHIANGDPKALRELYEYFKTRVYNTCLSYLQDENDAEETVQDVFIEVFQSADGFKGKSLVSTWIYRISVNKCLDKLRYKNRQKRFALVYSIFNKDTGAIQYDKLVFDHPGVKMENRELAAILFNAIRQLPENQQTAFILKQVEGLSQKEIADIMNMNVKAVESLLSRGKETLRKLLGDYYDSTQRKE